MKSTRTGRKPLLQFPCRATPSDRGFFDNHRGHMAAPKMPSIIHAISRLCCIFFLLGIAFYWIQWYVRCGVFVLKAFFWQAWFMRWYWKKWTNIAWKYSIQTFLTVSDYAQHSVECAIISLFLLLVLTKALILLELISDNSVGICLSSIIFLLLFLDESKSNYVQRKPMNNSSVIWRDLPSRFGEEGRIWVLIS